MSSIFENLHPYYIKRHEIYNIFAKDESVQKVDLCRGSYRTEEGKPWVFPVVRRIEKMMTEDPALNHEYLPNTGLDIFTQAATRLLLGESNKLVVNGLAFSIQGISDSGSMYIGFLFLTKILNLNTIYVSRPSYDNHVDQAKRTGFENIFEYRYYDEKNKGLDFEGMCEDLESAPEKSVVLLHACAHNPTGTDPTNPQWTKLSKIIKDKNLFPFFDCAYLGLASGCLEKDSWSVRHFAEEGHALFCAQSFSKNFGLYNERVGNLMVVVQSEEKIEAVKSQLRTLIRSTYLNPPNHGARIVAIALNSPHHYVEWLECVHIMHNRIKKARKELRNRLEARSKNGSWRHVTDQTGMFCYTGLSAAAIEKLRCRYHIYALSDGRINVTCLNGENLDYIADSIVKTLDELEIKK